MLCESWSFSDYEHRLESSLVSLSDVLYKILNTLFWENEKRSQLDDSRKDEAITIHDLFYFSF